MPSHHTPAPARAIAGRRLAWFFALVPILFALFVIAFVPEGEREASALDTLPVGADSTLAVELEEQLPDDEGQVAIVLWTAESGELDQATQDELTQQGTALLSQSGEKADGQGAPSPGRRPGRRVRPAGRVAGRTARWRRGAAVPCRGVRGQDRGDRRRSRLLDLGDRQHRPGRGPPRPAARGRPRRRRGPGHRTRWHPGRHRPGLRRRRHPPPRRDGRGRGHPADHHLPQPGAVAGPPDGRRHRRPPGRDRVDQRARGRQRGVGRVDRRHPQRARLRRRHRLRPAADLALPRRAQDHRVAPRGDGARARPHLRGGAVQRHDRRAGPAHPAALGDPDDSRAGPRVCRRRA